MTPFTKMELYATNGQISDITIRSAVDQLDTP